MKFTSFGQSVRAQAVQILCGLVLFSPMAAFAQRAVTLADIYAHAEKAPQIAAAASLALAQRAKIASARTLPDPQLQLGFMNRSLPSLAPMDPLGMTQIQLMQMLPLGGKLGLSGRIAGANAVAAEARAVDARWAVRARAAMEFYDLYAVQSQLRIAAETKLLLQDIARVSQTMYSVGDAKQADVLRAQVEIARMTEEITRMEVMRASTAARLAALLDAPVASIDGNAVLPWFPDSLPPLDALVAEAERNRPMIAAGEGELRSAEAGVALAKREIWPDLQLGFQYGWRSGEMGTDKMGSVMLGASVPLHARSRQIRMRDEAAAMRSMAEADLRAIRAETRGRMNELYADYIRTRNLRALYTTTILPQVEATISASFAAYRVGSVNLMALLDNQMTANRYRQELIALDAQRGKAIAEMEMLLGRELFSPDSISRNTP